MKKFSDYKLIPKAIIIYFLSIISSVLLYYPFAYLYIALIRPIKFGGGMFFPIAENVDFFFSGFIMAIIFFISFYVVALLSEKKWAIWVVGSFLPLLLFLLGSDIIDFIKVTIVSFSGWLLAQIVLLVKKQVSK